MSTAIRVLILEDRAPDAEIMLLELQRAGFEPIWQRVETKRDFLANLQPSLDVILADFTLPQFNALNASHLMKESGLDIPFIIVTGTVSEEVAVECMKQGAVDYLLKDRLARVGQAVVHTLEQRRLRLERQQTEARLRESEAKYRILFEKSRDAIYMVSDDDKFIDVNQSTLDLLGYTEEELKKLYIDHLFINPADRQALRRLMDEKGFVIDHEVKLRRKNGTEMDCQLTSTRHRTDNGSLAIRHGIIRDITNRNQCEIQLKQTLAQLKKALEGTIQGIASALEMRDPYTADHQKRVSQLACAIAQEMGLDGEQVEGIRLSGLIHDIGKIYVPAEILSKPGRISQAEFNVIKAHCQVGYDILKSIDFPWPIAQITLQHHERMNGSGYPSGLGRENILLEARILAVADVMEAMASHRPYRPTLGLEKALEEITQNRGILYDSDVVQAGLKLFSEGKFIFDDTSSGNI